MSRLRILTVPTQPSKNFPQTAANCSHVSLPNSAFRANYQAASAKVDGFESNTDILLRATCMALELRLGGSQGDVSVAPPSHPIQMSASQRYQQVPSKTQALDIGLGETLCFQKPISKGSYDK